MRALVAAAALLLSACASGLQVVQDEFRTEERIGAYLLKKGHKVTIATPNTQEVPGKVVILDMTSESVPDYRVIIKSQSSGQDRQTSRILERVVLVRLLSGVKLPRSSWGAALEVINQHHAASWAGTFTIDTDDGEVVGYYPINITLTYSIHPEMVRDAWVRLCMSWEDLYKKLRPLSREAQAVALTPP
ncbi:MAG: hypothetical protein RMK29_03605 [Myxococcales bacterium]|nr:hypothetical protein [Myxococcota bacterium]MDW8280772.1 hypothetical protein [Myxococcales bacterium]